RADKPGRSASDRIYKESGMATCLKSEKPRQNPASSGPLYKPTATNQALANVQADIIPPGRFNFSEIPIHPPPTKATHSRLTINEPGDQFEQEADKAAAAIMEGADLAQKPSIDSSSEGRAICLQRGSTGSTSALAPETVSAALHSPWQPLEAT